VARAEALLVTAGAGMGVDSGLPDFRGDHGFWRAYPPYAALGLSFAELASPGWFTRDVTLAWGFYGHRLNLYRQTRPHPGFGRLRAWAAARRLGGFVFTSNVDGHFQRAGFPADRVIECHGAIDLLQCLDGCGAPIFPAGADAVSVDPTTFRASPPYPSCPRCGGLARPNILMFGDDGWDPTRTEQQQRRFSSWLAEVRRARAPAVVIECGAGTAIPTVRMTSEEVARQLGATLVRINLREAEGPAGTVSIAGGAGEALAAIAGLLNAG
jgi:NAD-dependent SIR2 family protein deacetylase